MKFWRWLRSLWAHEHVYSLASYDSKGLLLDRPKFRCSCGDTIEGHELFRPDSMLGRYWLEQYPL